ncbi:unnamed protein product [Boreogadus saida]
MLLSRPRLRMSSFSRRMSSSSWPVMEVCLGEEAVLGLELQVESGAGRLRTASVSRGFRVAVHLDGVGWVYSELEILGSQMLCRNDQLRLLHLELKTKDCLLAKTDFQYSQRLEDIRLLKLDMRNLGRERSIQSKLASNAKDLR